MVLQRRVLPYLVKWWAITHCSSLLSHWFCLFVYIQLCSTHIPKLMPTTLFHSARQQTTSYQLGIWAAAGPHSLNGWMKMDSVIAPFEAAHMTPVVSTCDPYISKQHKTKVDNLQKSEWWEFWTRCTTWESLKSGGSCSVWEWLDGTKWSAMQWACILLKVSQAHWTDSRTEVISLVRASQKFNAIPDLLQNILFSCVSLWTEQYKYKV